MKISICQIEPIIGDIAANMQNIIEHINISQSDGCEICVFPELSITGYFCGDFFYYSNFINRANENFIKILSHTKNCNFDIFIGHVNVQNDKMYNSIFHIKNGEIINTYNKMYLANYGPCFDSRYFTTGDMNNRIININNKKVLLLICEEFWNKNNFTKYENENIDIALICNTSPFYIDKNIDRIDLCKQYKNINNFIYVNNIGLYDSVICDGNSFVFDKKNNTTLFLPKFEQKHKTIDLFNQNNGEFQPYNDYLKTQNKYETMFNACVFALTKYLKINGIEKISLALSGGIDSALVYIIALKCVGENNVFPIFLPSKYTSKQSFDDAIDICKLNGQNLEIINIDEFVESYKNINFVNNSSNGITLQNLQSRIRASIIMAHSNENSSIVLTTGNKSEISVGYCTLYGDTCGGYNPIKDIYKTDVFELCKYINSIKKIIPNSIIDKEPSAELAPNQKDSDSLPEYHILDNLLYQFIELKLMPNEICKTYDKTIVDKIWVLLNKNQFKRKQSAPGPCLSICDFENGRIIPVCTKI